MRQHENANRWQRAAALSYRYAATASACFYQFARVATMRGQLHTAIYYQREAADWHLQAVKHRDTWLSYGGEPKCEICGLYDGLHNTTFDGFACIECQMSWTEHATT